MNDKFNSAFNEEGEKPRFIHKPNPLIERSFQIFEYFEHKKSYEPIGEYTVIDEDENADITEKKLFNLMSIMNGKQRLIDFTNLTGERILFNIITRDPKIEQQKVVFRTHNGRGISKENAILVLDKGVFEDGQEQ